MAGRGGTYGQRPYQQEVGGLADGETGQDGKRSRGQAVDIGRNGVGEEAGPQRRHNHAELRYDRAGRRAGGWSRTKASCC